MQSANRRMLTEAAEVTTTSGEGQITMQVAMKGKVAWLLGATMCTEARKTHPARPGHQEDPWAQGGLTMPQKSVHRTLQAQVP